MVLVVERRFGIIDIVEVEILLLAHELRIAKFKKQIITDLVSFTLTHVIPRESSPDDIQTISDDSS